MLHHRISEIEEDTGRLAEKCEWKIRKPECSDEPEVEPSEETGNEYIILFEEGVSSLLNMSTVIFMNFLFIIFIL